MPTSERPHAPSFPFLGSGDAAACAHRPEFTRVSTAPGAFAPLLFLDAVDYPVDRRPPSIDDAINRLVQFADVLGRQAARLQLAPFARSGPVVPAHRFLRSD